MKKPLNSLLVGTAAIGIIVLCVFGVKLFRSFIPKQDAKQSWEETVLWAKGNKGDVLEVATRGATEKFEKITTYNWWIIYLGTTTVRIRVPVVFRYHILLSDPWDMTIFGDTCIVRCPPMHPSLPPAILTDGFEKYSDNAWSRWDAPQQLAELERDLTAELNQRAGNAESINSARDTARVSIAGFVRTWILTKDFIGRSDISKIKVIFPDEQDSSNLFSVHENTPKM